MQRVNALTSDYADALEKGQHGLAAVIRGELDHRIEHTGARHDVTEASSQYKRGQRLSMSKLLIQDDILRARRLR